MPFATLRVQPSARIRLTVPETVSLLLLVTSPLTIYHPSESVEVDEVISVTLLANV